MRKPEIMAALFAVFLNTDKAISELGDKDKRAAFEAEIEALAEQIEAKENKIASQALEISQTQMKVTTAESEGKTALDLATQKLVDKDAEMTAVQTELGAFGATAEERAAYVAEHTRLAGWYEAEKGDKNPQGNDVKGAKLDADKGDSGKKSTKEAKLEKLAGFPSLKAIVGR